MKQYKNIAQVQTNFVTALADLIEHPDCPLVFYGDLITLVEDCLMSTRNSHSY